MFTPQYWVIDAIDECDKYEDFLTMFKGENIGFPLRIFITSRRMREMQQIQRLLNTSALLCCIEIPSRDTIADITRYVRSRIDNLAMDSEEEKKTLSDIITRKSNTSFLWARMVLDKLEKVYSSEAMMAVLEEVPEDMVSFYERTVKTMSKNLLEKHISKAVLVWIVACARRLSISELSQALKLDINTVLPSAKSAVEGLCGQLVCIDKDSGQVGLIHSTAREFLLSGSAGEFQITEPAAHERIAMVCLQVLAGHEMRPPRNPRSLSQSRPGKSAMLDYVSTHFSEHIFAASPESDVLLGPVDRFLRTNGLSWIENLAEKGDFNCILRASKNIKAYLDRRAKRQFPPNTQAKDVDGWSTDLNRIVTHFGDALRQDPSIIHFLIPPLCPPGSVIHQQFGKRPDGLTIVGPRSIEWDDCIAHIDFEQEWATAVSCEENLAAIGMQSGDVSIYNHRSFQKVGMVRHKNPVDLLHLTDNKLVSCTTRSIVLHDLSGNVVWESRLRSRCLLLTSSDDCIVTVTQQGHLLTWDKSGGELLVDQEFEYLNHEDVRTEHNWLISRVPCLASVSDDLEMLVLGYRGGAVCLWDIRESELVGWARDDGERQVEEVFFNPNLEINLFLAIYTDHGLSLFDTWSATLVRSQAAPSEARIITASCSPNGRTLATVDSYGSIRIWDFESLSILYHIVSPRGSCRILNFTSDGLRIVDVTDSGMRIWSPVALARKNLDDKDGGSDDCAYIPITEGEYNSHKNSRVTALCSHPSLPLSFCGKYNGQVAAFSTKEAGDKPATLLYSHPQGVLVTNLAISNNNNFLASSDVAGTAQVWKLDSAAIRAESLLASLSVTARIKQLLFTDDGKYLLVATTESDSVYRVEDGFQVGTWPFARHERKIWRWLCIPGHPEHFILLADYTMCSYSAHNFPLRAGTGEIRLHYELDEGAGEIDADTATVHSQSKTLVLETRHYSGFAPSSTMFLFDISQVADTLLSAAADSSSPVSVVLTPINPPLSRRCKHFLGFSRTDASLLFLGKDSWVSSIRLRSLNGTRFTRHFFVPNDFLPSDFDVVPTKTAQDDIVFSQNGELIAVKNGLKFRQMKSLES